MAELTAAKVLKQYEGRPVSELETWHRHLDTLDAVADRCGRREGETVAELLKRLYDETLDDEN